MPDDFQAQEDMHTLARASEIEADQGRKARAKRAAESERDRFKRIAESIPGKPRRTFDGATKRSGFSRGRS